MSVHAPAREPRVPARRARAGAGATVHTAMDTPVGSRREKANCESCGRGWFGAVAYCPYCGQPAAGALAAEALPEATQAPAQDVPPYAGSNMRPFGPPEGELRDPPRIRWKARWKPVVVAAAALAAVAIVVGELAVTAADRAGPPGARQAEAVGARGSDRFQASDHVAAPSGRNRLLCSPANEAAGLCKPQ